MSEAFASAKRAFQDLLALAAERGASDLHLKDGRPPVLRINGKIQYTDLPAMTSDEIAALADTVMDDRLRQVLAERGDADFSCTIRTGDRFRVNVFRERGRTGLAARRVNRNIPSFDDLHLPRESMELICRARQGLVLFSGVAGSGKSTSIAACIEAINAQRACHIVTIEDPIEYLFEDKKAFIHQREIGTDVASFEAALPALLREDPDVVLVGEMRTPESLEGALRAAVTSRLVFTTLHARRAPAAIARILDLAGPHDQQRIRESVANSLVAVICQQLVPAIDPNVARLPATEVMIATSSVRKAIREGEDERLEALISAGGEAGMHDMTQDLARLVEEEWVEPKAAYEAAPNPEALRMVIRGIGFQKGTLR